MSLPMGAYVAAGDAFREEMNKTRDVGRSVAAALEAAAEVIRADEGKHLIMQIQMRANNAAASGGAIESAVLDRLIELLRADNKYSVNLDGD